MLRRSRHTLPLIARQWAAAETGASSSAGAFAAAATAAGHPPAAARALLRGRHQRGGPPLLPMRLLLQQQRCKHDMTMAMAASHSVMQGGSQQPPGAGGGGGGGSGGGGGAGRAFAFLCGAAAGSLATSLWDGTAPGSDSGRIGGGSSSSSSSSSSFDSSRAASRDGRGDAAAPAAPLLQAASERLAHAAGALGTAFMNASVLEKFAMLIACTLPAVFVGAAALKANVGGLTWPAALMRTFSLVFRVPPPMANETTAGAHLVTHTTFLLGFFAFALVLSVVNEAVQRQFAFVRGGRLPVRCDDHFLLLGFNDTVVPMLQQLARPPGAKAGGWPGSVVILTDRVPKQELDARLKEELTDKGYVLDVHTRAGVAFKAADLAHAGAHRARHIILLAGQEDAGAPATEALSAAAAMSLAALKARRGDQSVVVQVPGAGAPSGAEVLLGLAGSAGLTSVRSRFRALETPGSMFVSRLIAQAACEPGILRCWTELLNPADATPQLRALPAGAVAGATFGEARASCKDIAVGIVCGSGGNGTGSGGGNGSGDGSGSNGGSGVCVSPPDDTPLGPQDRLIVLTRGGSGGGGGGGGDFDSCGAEAQRQAAEAARARLALKRSRKARWLVPGGGASTAKTPRRILVVGWPAAELPTLLDGLETFGAGTGGALVTVVSPDEAPAAVLEDEEQQRQRAARWWGLGRWLPARGGARGCRVRYVRSAEPLSVDTLAAAGIADCDAIVVGAAQQRPSAAAAPGRHSAAEAAANGGGGAPPQPADETPLVRDARVMHALLSLQRALLASDRGSAPHVVAPVSALASAELARDFFTAMRDEAAAGSATTAAAAAASANAAAVSTTTTAADAAGAAVDTPRDSCGVLGPAYLDFLKPNGVIAALLLQESLDDTYSRLMRELLWSAEGHELYLRRPEDLGVAPGEAVTFAELSEAARQTDAQTALGIVRGGGESVELAPAPGAVIKLEAGDRVLVIAED